MLTTVAWNGIWALHHCFCRSILLVPLNLESKILFHWGRYGQIACAWDTLSLQINVHKWNKKLIPVSLLTVGCSCIFGGSSRNGLFAVSRNSCGGGGAVAGRGRLQATAEGEISRAETLPSASFKKKDWKNMLFYTNLYAYIGIYPIIMNDVFI